MYTYNLGQSFIQIVKKFSKKKAIIFCDNSYITYQEFDNLSNQIARFLIYKHVTKGNVVAIQNSKTAFGFAAMIACIKLGIIYTNFDFNNPNERIKKIFLTAQPVLVLADQTISIHVSQLCHTMKIPFFSYTDSNVKYQIEKQLITLDQEIINNITDENPIYIMFTSGSTGIPKGVLIRQKSILNFIKWGKEIYSLSKEDIITNVNPIYFDNSVFDFYCSIFNGITMAAFPQEIIMQPKKLIALINELNCTFWFSVPSLLIYLMNMKVLDNKAFKSIKKIAFGGEAYPKESLQKLFDLYKNRISFYNVYGPTEGTCICSVHQIKQQDFNENEHYITLGEITHNFDYLILDNHNHKVKQGELCLMGPQLALGYYNDKERTEKTFVKNPLNKLYYEKIYRTGDYVKETSKKLYFLGRIDNQIKHMGYRIELEEIESNLMKLPYIRECAVVHGYNKAGFSKLAAIIASENKIEEQKIRQDLRSYLPDYMIPNIVVFYEILPKNENGKIDRVLLKHSLDLIHT